MEVSPEFSVVSQKKLHLATTRNPVTLPNVRKNRKLFVPIEECRRQQIHFENTFDAMSIEVVCSQCFRQNVDERKLIALEFTIPDPSVSKAV